jgi:hypothetical protein
VESIDPEPEIFFAVLPPFEKLVAPVIWVPLLPPLPAAAYWAVVFPCQPKPLTPPPALYVVPLITMPELPPGDPALLGVWL